MSNKAIEQLATYFTGSNVVAASIALEMRGPAARPLAQSFFAMRSALGIEGYVSRDEAISLIRAHLDGGA